MASLTPVSTYAKKKNVSPPKLQVEEDDKENTENGWADCSQDFSSQDDANGSIDDFFLFDVEKTKMVKEEINEQTDSIRPPILPVNSVNETDSHNPVHPS